MRVATPHYLLFSESCRKKSQGEWRFVLQSLDGQEQFEAADSEPDAHGERLELLAVVRGLEALEQPSRVTLVTPSRYVNRGLTYGLEEWRANDWQWEHYGEMVPVKNRDLWQRMDRALSFHKLDCRTWRFDLPHFAADTPPSACSTAHGAPPHSSPRSEGLVEQPRHTNRGAFPSWGALEDAARAKNVVPPPRRSLGSRLRRLLLACERWLCDRLGGWKLWLSQCGTRLLPLPWLE